MMGKDTSIFELDKELALPTSVPLTIVAARHQIEPLRAAAASGWLAEASFLECAIDEALPLEGIPHTGVAVVEVNPGVSRSMDRIKQFHLERPDVTLVVAIAEADVRTVRMLVREGVADVVALPFSAEEIFETLVAVMETAPAAAEQRTRLAPMLALMRATGGVGATSIATHLAAAIAAEGHRVCVIDLDIQSGRVAEVLGLSARRNLTDLLEAGLRLDDAVLRSVVAHHDSGIDVVAAPAEIVPIEAIEEPALARLLQLVRQDYDYVVIDFPANLANWSLSVLSHADAILPVVEQSLGSLRQTRRVLDLLAGLGLDPRLVMPVVNRVEKRLFKSIGIGDVEHALGRSVTATVASEPHALTAAQDQGLLIGSTKSKSAFSSDIRRLAELVLARYPAGGTQ